MDFISVGGIQRNVNLDAPAIIGFHSSLFSDMIKDTPISFKFLFNGISTCSFGRLLDFPNAVSSFPLIR